MTLNLLTLLNQYAKIKEMKTGMSSGRYTAIQMKREQRPEVKAEMAHRQVMRQAFRLAYAKKAQS